MSAHRRALPVFVLAGLALGLLGMPCGSFNTIVIDTPANEQLVQDGTLDVEARVAGTFDASTVEVRVGGVDLIAALGLVPPFSGAGGVVVIGADNVTIAGFTYDPTLPGQAKALDLSASGFSEGPSSLEVSGIRNGQATVVTDTADFQIVAPLGLVAESGSAGGMLQGAQAAGAGSTLANASLAGTPAAAPIALPGGGALRSGFVEAAEAKIAGGGP